MKITVLMENLAHEGLEAEHGLSLFAEYGGRRYLLDSGATGDFARNAEKLGIDLRTVDAAFLSHAHFDHSGGFDRFFELNTRARLYLQDACAEDCWSGAPSGDRYIGIPIGLLERFRARLRFVNGSRQVEPGVWIVAHSTPGLEERARRAFMCRRNAGGLVPDDFSHEQSVVFETEKGLVIINGCCHAGADNVVREVMKALPGRPVAALIGGFHLMGPAGVSTLGCAPEEAASLGRTLLELGVGRVLTCHCTGKPGFEILRDVMGGRAEYFMTGDTAEI